MYTSKLSRGHRPHTIPVSTRSLEPLKEYVRQSGERQSDILAAAVKATYFLLRLERTYGCRLYASLYSAEVEQAARAMNILRGMQFATCSSDSFEIEIGDAYSDAQKAYHLASISRLAVAHAACLTAKEVLDIVTPKEYSEGSFDRGYIFAKSERDNAWSVWPRNISASRELCSLGPSKILRGIVTTETWASLGDSSVLPSKLAYEVS